MVPAYVACARPAACVRRAMPETPEVMLQVKGDMVLQRTDNGGKGAAGTVSNAMAWQYVQSHHPGWVPLS